MLDGIALTGDKFVDEFNQNRFSFIPLKSLGLQNSSRAPWEFELDPLQSPIAILFFEAIMQKFRSLFSPSVLIVSMILSLSCAIPGLAQVDRSALTGMVTDPAGKLLGKAHITVVENSTQLRREGDSD